MWGTVSQEGGTADAKALKEELARGTARRWCSWGQVREGEREREMRPERE